MKTLFSTVILFILSNCCFSQDLSFKNGNIYNSEMKKLKTVEVREILSANPEALKLYNQGKSKGGTGGFLVGFGIGLMIGDLGAGLFGTAEYPSALTFVGATSFAIGIPVSIGTNKKIRKSLEIYNNKKTVFNIEKSSIIVNQSGIGMRVNF